MSESPLRPIREVWIVSAVRTPIGRYGGALRSVRPDDLAALVLRAAVERAGVDPALIDDVILGNANGAGEENRNVARMAALLAGFPVEVPGQTVNRLCGSGLQAIATGTQAIAAGEAEIVLVGGVESMTRAPWVLPKPEAGFERGDHVLVDTTLGWRLVNPALREAGHAVSLGETAERVAERHAVSREEQDAFALRSQQRAAAAIAAGRFADQIVPVPVRGPRGETTLVERDEHPRPEVTADDLARLPAAFREGGSVTAGNSSGLNDGAGALLLVEAERARALGLRPMARVVRTTVAGIAPEMMGMGPVPAVRRLLALEGRSVAEIDLVELNEAFASQSVACIRELALDPEKVNVNGGGIALGHPLGMSGARLMTMLVHELARRGGRLGLAAMCIGVGQGIATLVERPEA